MNKATIITILLMMSFSTFSRADFAPSSGEGMGVKIDITSGTGLLAINGEALLFTDPESNKFILFR